mmetsp:Transcript_29809/g.68068  ORF Transcript_29809/g.68068 Transcript_29809/m.68068 type:complete len:87 (-) Transcript_29809:19-279(-)
MSLPLYKGNFCMTNLPDADVVVAVVVADSAATSAVCGPSELGFFPGSFLRAYRLLLDFRQCLLMLAAVYFLAVPFHIRSFVLRICR